MPSIFSKIIAGEIPCYKIAENEKFIVKGSKASAARARKALQEIAGACKERRKEITAAKEAMEAKK